MKVRRVDANNDWTFGRGLANYADTTESAAQRVKTRLQSFVNDWFLDLEHGLNWLPNMERPANLNAIENSVKSCILNTTDIIEIISFEMITNENRQLQIITTVKDRFDNETQIITD
ncbi:hypothetical protein [Entomomonas asaccharolytica]|uniref:Uncharacterized protein n=1 Tax=Entomomonas asaccharolytica TaxID=2785331 RepID=A0A974NHP0_9GAMM|nr:hypothetical protein [Entomomonas asaccharolytica]QQP86951.1 hypothetical protein JHT90_06815 [Entomomonas asaccharolytica]